MFLTSGLPGSDPNRPRRIRIKPIALPSEHGAWGFLLEPILLAMLVAPTSAGTFWSVGVAAAFLSRHPLKVWLRHRNNVAHARRKQVAAWVAAIYVVIAAAGFAAAISLAGWKPGLPIALLIPFNAVFVLYDVKNRARDVIPEFAGPLGLAASAPCIAVAAGWSWTAAAALWVLMVARAVPSIAYIRARLRLERGKPINRMTVALHHIVFACVIALLVWRGLTPPHALVAFGVLAFRAALGLSPYRRFTRARQIGILEIVLGMFYVAVIAAGFAFYH